MAWPRTDRLGGPAAVLRCIEARAPQDVAGISATLGLHPNTVRKHLARLLEWGTIVEEADRTRRPGRPRRVYRPAPSPAPALLRLARQLGRSAGGAESSAAPDAAGAVARVTAMHGLDPHCDGDDIVVSTCPFRGPGPAAALCALHLGLVEGAAAAHGAAASVTMHDGGPPCRFHLHTVER